MTGDLWDDYPMAQRSGLGEPASGPMFAGREVELDLLISRLGDLDATARGPC